MKIKWNERNSVGYLSGIVVGQRISFFVCYNYFDGCWAFTAAIRGIEIRGKHGYAGADQAQRACQRLANHLKARVVTE